MRAAFLALLMALGLAGAAPLAAQGAPAADYRVGPGDVLRIAAFQSPELSLDVQVSDSGKISYPLVGVVEVAGQSPFDIGRLLERRLREGNYFKQPQINVLIADYRSRMVSVAGQVYRPGRYPIDRGTLRLSEVIALAGGVQPTGADDVTVLRDGAKGPERLTVNLAALFAGQGAAPDLTVQGGDRIFVDKAPRMYVRGEVQRPGEFQITPGISVGQALAVAGGVTPRGNEGNIDVFRLSGGKRTKLDGRRGDIVQPGDEIVVRERVF